MHPRLILLSLCLATALPVLAGEDKDVTDLYHSTAPPAMAPRSIRAPTAR
jgi:hypothetical protein